MNPSRLRRAERRSGSVIAIVLLALSTVFAIVAVAINVARLGQTRDQLRAACESAALASTAQLLDSNTLRGVPADSDNFLRLKLTAQYWASLNAADSQGVVLDLNLTNAPSGDIVVGRCVEPLLVGSGLTPWSKFGAGRDVIPNSVLVRAERSCLRSQPVFLWLGDLLGVIAGDVAAQARATLDHRIYGFRPIAGTAAPVAPLGVDRAAWLEQTDLAASATDNYTVDYASGRVTTGSDGITELRLSAALAGTAATGDGDLVRLSLDANSPGDDSTAQRQLATGLTVDDLVSLGGEFSIPSQGLSLRASDVLGPSWVDAFLASSGKIRVWPLVVPATSSESSTTVTTAVLGFGAAVVVDAFLDTSGPQPKLIVVLQPALLPTSTALVDPSANENAWIAKLMLTQ